MKKLIKNKDGIVTKVITVNEKPSRTQKHMLDMTDANNILKKYKTWRPELTGVPQDVTHRSKLGVYADISEIPSYQDALATVIEAQQTFMALPSDIRKKFSNDPNELIEFLKDPQNTEEGIKLGLIQKPEVIKPNEQTQILNEIKNELKKPNKQKTQQSSDET